MQSLGWALEKTMDFFGAIASRRICKREALDRRAKRAHGRRPTARIEKGA
jgi:hypothetical protein